MGWTRRRIPPVVVLAAKVTGAIHIRYATPSGRQASYLKELSRAQTSRLNDFSAPSPTVAWSGYETTEGIE
jgi:hypothetical protein